MGWDSDSRWKSKKDVVADLLRPNRFDSLIVIKSKVTGAGLWFVVENPETNLRAIYFDVIEKQDGDWYTKGMAESEHPYYFDCPKEFLDLVPPLASKAFMFNAEWRAAWLRVNTCEVPNTLDNPTKTRI